METWDKFDSDIYYLLLDFEELVDKALETFIRESNNKSFFIVNFIFIPSFFFYILIITVENVKTSLISYIYLKILITFPVEKLLILNNFTQPLYLFLIFL